MEIDCQCVSLSNPTFRNVSPLGQLYGKGIGTSSAHGDKLSGHNASSFNQDNWNADVGRPLTPLPADAWFGAVQVRLILDRLVEQLLGCMSGTFRVASGRSTFFLP
jgi:hypothetical protein